MTSVLAPGVLFDDTQVTLVEEGQPGEKHILQAFYTLDQWEFTLRENYFGEVSGSCPVAPTACR